MEEKKYLNGYTILSFNPNNIFISFNTETLLFDDKIWEDENAFYQNIEEESENNNNEQEEYWIIEENGINEIFVKNQHTENEFNSKRIKAGPFFSIETVV